MTTFWIGAVALTALALFIVLRPLLSGQSLSTLDQQNANVAIFRRRLAELEAERASGQLSEADATEAKLELERQLLGDLGDERTPVSGRRGYLAAAVVAVAVPAVALTLYLQLGDPSTLRGPQVSAEQAETARQLAVIRERIGELEAMVAAEPGNLEALLMLGQAYIVLERYDDAVTLFRNAQLRHGESPMLLASEAEALGYAQRGDLSGRPTTLIQRALEIDPAYAKALWLAGLAEMQQQRPQQAAGYWRRLLATLPPDSEAAAEVRNVLARLGEEPAAAPSAGAAATAVVQANVRLAPALAERVPDGATLFILARAVDGPRAPLAVVRQPATQLPVAVRLDESMAMMPGVSLKEYPNVIVEARVSASGNATSRPGDLIGRSEPVTVGAGAPVDVVIDQVVQ